MVENKDAESLKETENINLKIYYTGDTLMDSGMKEVSVPLPSSAKVWLIKEVLFSTEDLQFRRSDGVKQFVECSRTYDDILGNMDRIISASIVNEKQKKAIMGLINDVLWRALLEDNAHGNDFLTSAKRDV